MTQDVSLDLATGPTAADRRRAALVVCHYAQDTEEATLLLDALGLPEDLRGQRLAS